METLLRRLATLPPHSPLYPREQTSHIELSLFFLTKFANRVAVLVHTHNKRVYIDTPLLEYYQRDVLV